MRSQKTRRRAITLLELAGCLTALSGGLLAGACYLGVDLKDAALRTLLYADVLRVPAQTPSGETNPRDAALAAASRDPLAQASMGQTLAVAAERLTGAVRRRLESELAEIEGQEVAPSEAEQRTTDFWNGFCQILENETLRRTAPAAQGKTRHAYELREASHRRALTELESLSMTGVDPQVRNHAKRVISWQHQGSELYRKAVELLANTRGAQLSGPLAVHWRSAATHHRMELRLLEQKHAAISAYLARGAATEASAPSSDP